MRKRTHTCGELRSEDAGKQVVLNGWVARVRDHGGLLFIDLRDRYGKTQVVVKPKENQTLYEDASRLHSEWVVSVEGEVALRPSGTANRQMPTGEVEVHARRIEILNRSLPLPFPVEEEEVHASEELRLRYRYLDLRRPEMQEIFLLRHQVCRIVRDHFSPHGFLEMETPCLVKSTPEGARDYLVPSRVHPGKFYALPQSPQIYKQILMVAGFDRYFQIVRCFRDEDLRSDRQPEFTQVDVEFSFPTQEMIFEVAESLFHKVFKAAWDVDLPIPFPRLTYREVMTKYGTDKPDLRFGMPLVDLTDYLQETDFRIVKEAIDKGGVALGICVKGEAGRTRRQIDEFDAAAKKAGLGGILPVKLTSEGPQGSLVSHLAPSVMNEIIKRMEAQSGDLLLLAVGLR
ncbi:MAG: aspartate--tRNA ligase, partial [Calditrichaeota bacterium]|nr:aspartate--tRNA ligase [Calditrichota bacterium]